MKKLMIAAAIVCAVAMSQAAEFKWSTNAKLYHFQTANDLTSLVDGNTYDALTTGTKGYVDQLNNATWAFEMVLSDGVGSETLTGTLDTFSSHKVGQKLTSDFFALPTDESTKTYTWDIVITGNYTDANGNEWVLTSDTIHGSKDYTKMSDLGLSSGVATKWTVTSAGGDVPEPTSGLLLLLGVAGLALRRRHA